MPNIDDLMLSPQRRRWKTASKVKKLKDITPFPKLPVWNYSPCEHHSTPSPSCRYRACGGEPFSYQKVTATYSYMARRSLVANSTGTGKQQPVSEPVLTPSGWIPIGNLKVGDYVMSPTTGRPTEVLEIHPQTERRVYRLTFNDGSYTHAGPEHLWLAGSKASLHQGGTMKVVTTEKMKDTIHREWSIPMTVPVEFDEIALPCDPYLLGVVLGDGAVNKSGGATLCTDLEIIDSLGLHLTRTHETSDYTGYAQATADMLGGALSFPSRSWEKVIPEAFMMGASNQRLAIIQGLLDSDGYPMHTGGVEFTTTSAILADQVVELVQSIGGVARKSAGRFTKYTHNGERRVGRESWRVNVKLPSGVEPFRLTRKLDKWVPPTKYQAKRVLRSVDRVDDEDSVCITVAAEDSLYLTRGYIVTHNTISALTTLAMADYYKEEVRCIIVVPSGAVAQWEREAKRWTPGFLVKSVLPGTPREHRVNTYASPWNILIIGYQVFTRDIDMIEKVNHKQIIVDDVDPMLKVKNKTYSALFSMCSQAEMSIVMNATLVSMHIDQIYASTSLIGGHEVFGSHGAFVREYVKKEKVTIVNRQGEKKRVFQSVGYKNMSSLLKKFRPMYIRFSYEDIAEDITIPDLITKEIYLPMSPLQRTRYSELQQGIRKILDDDGFTAKQKTINSLAAFTLGSQICSGMFSMRTLSGKQEPDGPEASPKLDFIMKLLSGEWRGTKTVVYAKYRGAIQALQSRLDKEGIGNSTIWGMETDPMVRDAEMTKFWEDPNCDVMIISVSGERSLNLQVANKIILWDLQLNPSRVTQIAGRVRRVGSKHSKVLVLQLLHEDTQEERYTTALAARAALMDYMYDESKSEDDSQALLFNKLTSSELVKLIAP